MGVNYFMISKASFPQGIHFDPASAQTLRLEFARTNSRVSPKQQVYTPQQSLNLANASTTIPHARNGQCKLFQDHINLYLYAFVYML